MNIVARKGTAMITIGRTDLRELFDSSRLRKPLSLCGANWKVSERMLAHGKVGTSGASVRRDSCCHLGPSLHRVAQRRGRILTRNQCRRILGRELRPDKARPYGCTRNTNEG